MKTLIQAALVVAMLAGFAAAALQAEAASRPANPIKCDSFQGTCIGTCSNGCSTSCSTCLVE